MGKKIVVSHIGPMMAGFTTALHSQGIKVVRGEPYIVGGVTYYRAEYDGEDEGQFILNMLGLQKVAAVPTADGKNKIPSLRYTLDDIKTARLFFQHKTVKELAETLGVKPANVSYTVTWLFGQITKKFNDPKDSGSIPYTPSSRYRLGKNGDGDEVVHWDITVHRARLHPDFWLVQLAILEDELLDYQESMRE